MKALTKATIYAVAQRAGVSIATVSRALRDSDLVTAETRARVRAAADELNFTPSRLGRSLAEGRHAANGIVFPDLVGPYYAEVILGYEATAAEVGSSVLILATHARPDAVAAVQDLAGRVDGMAIMLQTVADEVVEKIRDTGLPLVLIARPPIDGVDTVRTRNERTAQALADHLLGHGHRRFVFMGDPGGSPDVAGRYAGVRSTAPVVVPCDLDLESGRAAAADVLRDPPDAIICANDEVALGVHLAAEEAGLTIGRDVAVTGWDDVLAARFAGLTTASQPMRALGATAARWLHERIQDPDRKPRRRVLDTELVVRRSCGTHPRQERKP
jgi:LacI family transcriptional regulator